MSTEPPTALTTVEQHTRVVSFQVDRRGPCSWILNLLWLVIGGWHLWLTWFVAGLVLCLTCVGIPCGWQAIKISCFLLFPFGKRLVYTNDSMEGGTARCCAYSCTCIFNILWAVCIGWILALQAILTGIILMLTICGIPLGWKCFQFAFIAFRPFGVDFTAEETVVVSTTTTTTSSTPLLPPV